MGGVSKFSPEVYMDIFSPGDPEGSAWLARFLELAERMGDELDQVLAIEAVQHDAVEATAHRLAGTACSVGAMRLGEAARALEHAEPTEEVAALRSLQAQLRRELAEARVAIATFLSDTQAGTIS
jgi:HPt (histidine-containing phosphotransfer) domain-containing protein